MTEETAAEPAVESGRILRETENAVLGAGGCVLRLAGLYGPGRSVLLKRFLLGEARIDVRTQPPATPDGRWINQIHRDDAAAAVASALENQCAGIFNVADRTPMTQRTVYARTGPAVFPPVAAGRRAGTRPQTRLDSQTRQLGKAGGHRLAAAVSFMV